VDPRTVARVLSEIAEIASETLELQEVFERVATSVRQLVPLDNMGVVRIVDGQRAVLHATTVPCEGGEDSDCTEPLPLTEWSPRLRPRGGPSPRIDDAPAELDASFRIDALVLESGVRSALWEPFHAGDTFAGGVWISAYRTHAFNDEHQEVLRPIAALLGSAVEHWRIWDADRRRRDRLDQLEALLGTLAESLDVRDVFERISQAVQPILPHDLLALSELDVRANTLRIVATAGTADIPPPDPSHRFALSDAEKGQRAQDVEIVKDIPADFAAATERERLMMSTGMRSCLRVPVRLSGEVSGSIVFFHREPDLYGRDHTEAARRLADRVSLMLSHQRLAEEARVAAEAKERAERLAATVETLARELESRERSRIVGSSRSWKETLLRVGRVASSETTVLITGESGTGKEVVAHLIHQGSGRAGRPFVAINCAALPEQLLESELFGHEKGSFTGATATKIGRIEQAAGGTLFLDEIAEMSPLLQAKLLRVLQEREFQRVGGTRTLRADVRLISATNRDLAAAIGRQEFREDLFYRLNVFEIRIAPLRERPEDILPLADVFLKELGRTMGRPAAGISREARDGLLAYPWPGNVRELRNAIERAILLCDGGLIARAHLPSLPATAPAIPSGVTPILISLPAHGVDLEAVERDFVQKALGQSRGNKSKAARLLGLTRAQLYSRLEKYGIQ
jgi:transcriptional regulator with GAF, ATPase, and Fis domain